MRYGINNLTAVSRATAIVPLVAGMALSIAFGMELVTPAPVAAAISFPSTDAAGGSSELVDAGRTEAPVAVAPYAALAVGSGAFSHRSDILEQVAGVPARCRAHSAASPFAKGFGALHQGLSGRLVDRLPVSG